MFPPAPPLPNFYPTSREIRTARASDFPYIPGDFTLVYHASVQALHIKTDEEKKQTLAKMYADMKAQYQARVTNGEITQDRADELIGSISFGLAPDTRDCTVVLSCRKGQIYYQQTSQPAGGESIACLFRSDNVYSIYAKQANIDRTINLAAMDLFCFPGAGFAHFPLSGHAVKGQGSLPVSDLPLFAGNGQSHPGDGSLISPMRRVPGLVTLSPEGIEKVQLMNGDMEYDFLRHQMLNGVPIASNFTWTRFGRRVTYTLQSAAGQALPDANFDPNQLLAGLRVQFSQGKDNYFSLLNFDPAKGSLDDQMKAQVQQRAAEQAAEKAIEAMPGKAPDIDPIYTAALKRAGKNGKLVLTLTTASNCYFCHRLADLLADPTIKPFVDSRFEIVWIDAGEAPQKKNLENKNGWALIHRLDLDTGFPSYAAITPAAQVLQRSESIGYPANPADAKVLVKLLGAGKPLTDEERAAVENYLKAHPG